MIHFSKYWYLYLTISLTVILTGIYSYTQYGYKYSIDFTGGSEASFMLSEGKIAIERDELSKLLKDQKAELVSYDIRGDVINIRAADLSQSSISSLQTSLEKATGKSATLLRFDEVGPTVASDMITKTLVAIALGALIILGYIFYAFKRLNFAFAAVIAMFHDVLVVLGVYSLMGHFFGAQLDTLFVTAILTTMSFSVHDTIVIFDKIREYKKSSPGHDLSELADMAVSSTMIRSLNNSLTILFMLLALATLGGDSIRFFAITLLVGTISGAYSSPFVATPVMIFIEKLFKSREH